MVWLTRSAVIGFVFSGIAVLPLRAAEPVATPPSANGENVEAAIAQAMKIQSDTKRYDSLKQIAASGATNSDTTPQIPGQAGGAAQADFDTLIELVTTTVAPDSWEEVGGTGTVAGFPTGVSLDARNRRLETNTNLEQPLVLKNGETVPASEFVAAATLDGRRSVSLPRLESAVLARFAAGLPPTEEMLSVGGLGRIDYVVVYPELNDVVLVGPAIEDLELRRAHGLHLSDLAVALHNALQGSGRMVCSITPSQANLARTQEYLAQTGKRPLKPGQRDAWLDGLRESLGKQDVEFEDVEPDSHLALTLLAADYHMKLIGMGIKPGGPVESYLSTVRLNPDGSAPSMAVLRWWFTLQPKPIEANADKTVFRLPVQLLQVQSENEMLADRGVRQHTGESEPLNRDFAQRFTRNFPGLAEQYPVYAQLHRTAELTVAASLLRDQRLCERAGWEPTFLVSQDPYLVPAMAVPRQVDTVVNHRVLDRKTFIAGVSGGVEFKPRTLPDQLKVTDDYALRHRERVAAPAEARHIARQSSLQWWWD